MEMDKTNNHIGTELGMNDINKKDDLNGIFDGVYYENGVPVHKGVFKIGEDIYYAGRGGRIAADERHAVHTSMSNGILKRGVYKFAADGKLVPGSYIKPEKRKKKTLKNLFGSSKRYGLLIALFALFLCAIIIIPGLFDQKPSDSKDSKPAEGNSVEVQSDEIALPVFTEPVYLCRDPVADYYKGILTLEEACRLNNGAGPYKGFEFRYEILNRAEGSAGGYEIRAVLEISEDKEFGSSDQYVLDPGKTSITIDNLYPGTTYYYRVITKEITSDNTGEEKTYSGQFSTADTDRFIYIADLKNTRDLGGYKTLDGKTTKYGMLIRGSEIDGLVESDYFLTDRETAESFGFACDLDLREESLFNGNYKSMLGENVAHRFYSSPSYGSIFSESNKEELQAIFHDLANPDNYPMYLHCTYGADRTGTIIFLIQGILGVNEEDMARQYALTGFWLKSYTAKKLNPIYGGLEGTEGDTINEKIENYLVEVIGVPMSEIESIRSILLEK